MLDVNKVYQSKQYLLRLVLVLCFSENMADTEAKIRRFLKYDDYAALKDTVNQVSTDQVVELVCFSIKYAAMTCFKFLMINWPNVPLNDALVFAAKFDRYEVAKLLLDRGADPNATSTKGTRTPLTMAIHKRSMSVFWLLVDTPDIQLAPKIDDIVQPAYLAAYRKNLICFRALVDRGVKLNTYYDGNYNILHFVADNGYREFIELIVKRGVPVNIETIECKYTPLHIAVMKKHWRSVALLISLGADVTARTERGSTALHLAVDGYCTCDYGSYDVDEWTDEITEIRPPVSAKDISILLNAGADPNAIDEQDNTAADLCCEHCQTKVRDFLLSAQDLAGSATKAACRRPGRK